MPLRITSYVSVYHCIFFFSQEILEFVGWELIGVLSHYLNDEAGEMASNFNHCKKILDAVAEVHKLSAIGISDRHRVYPKTDTRNKRPVSDAC